jgi:flagellar hook-length control protein FliK
MQDAIRTSTQPLRNHLEAVGPEHAGNRSLELPQQFATSQMQQAVTALSASGHSHATVGTATAPAVTQYALPAQLETMNLARTADAGEWGNGLGERVNWMINQKQNSAIIRLDPPMLGKLDVQIKIADDATTITIHTQHAQTRDLIETASVRLRDFLQESGYQNVNVDVSQRQDQQQNRSQAAFEEDPGNRELNQEQDGPQAHHQPASYFTGDGLLDTFA